MRWTVPRMWEGDTCIIMAGGPSMNDLIGEVVRIDGYPRVITINDSWRLAPWADVFYFYDREWYDEQVKTNRVSCGTAFRKLAETGLWVSGNEEFASHSLVRSLRLTGQRGLEINPAGLRHGSNSGYQAINLAYHLGAGRILLLGYDMRVQSPAAPGQRERTHWHDEPRAADFGQALVHTFLPHFESLVEPLAREKVEVINCTPGSALTCWPYVPLAEAVSS